MTQLGTFYEGLILVVLGVLMTVVGKYAGIDFSNDSTLIIGAGMGYITGGAAGKSNGTTPSH